MGFHAAKSSGMVLCLLLLLHLGFAAANLDAQTRTATPKPTVTPKPAATPKVTPKPLTTPTPLPKLTPSPVPVPVPVPVPTESPSPEPTATPEPGPVTTEAPKAKAITFDHDISINIDWAFAWLGQGYPTSPDATHTDVNGIRPSSSLHIPGIGVSVKLSDTIRLSPEIDFSFDEYIYKTSLAMAFPTFRETGQGAGGPVATVMGLLVSVPVDFRIKLTDTINLELSPGLAFYPLIPVAALDNSTGIEAIGEYLNKDLKWIYPLTSVQLSFLLNKNIEAAARIRVLYPLWHAWSGDTLPFYDHMTVDGGLIIRFIP